MIKRLLTMPRAVFSLLVFLILLAVATLSWIWLPHSPTHADASHIWASPSAVHLLGTDGSGRDILSRLILGSRTTVVVAVLTGVLSLLIGLSLAWLGALGPRKVREPVTVLVDVLIAFPTLLIAMMLAAVFGSGIPVVVASLGIGFGVAVARVVRGELSQVAREDYVLAARAVGLSRSKILWRHILPGASPVVIVQVSLVMGLAVLAESSLSYLGFGAPPDVPSWGRMLAETQDAISIFPLTVAWPGLAITAVSLAFFVFGDALRVAIDPSTKLRLEAMRT
jgi:peptide/nickel transport system permease protein